jgi:phosphoribosylformylglycinamidine synthase
VTKIIVDVMLKRRFMTRRRAFCQRLGYGDVVGVRQGKRFEVELRGEADDSALTRVEALAGELLANPVIEEFVLRAE